MLLDAEIWHPKFPRFAIFAKRDEFGMRIIATQLAREAAKRHKRRCEVYQIAQ